jgi:tricorn protease
MTACLPRRLRYAPTRVRDRQGARFALGAVLLLMASTVLARSGAILPREPTVYGRQIVFVYADRLWSVGTDGGEARLLTTGPGKASHPHFSPDGRLIAFTLDEDDNEDVYVMPAAGGPATRLTWHPDPDEVVGWTPDGKSVLFRSARASYQSFDRLFTVSVDGGLPSQLPLPTAEEGSYSPDGRQIAYVPLTYMNPHQSFKHYHGGRQARIWIARLADSSITRIPHQDSQDFNPMWVGGQIYFLSDRDNGTVSLYRYDPRDAKVSEVLPAQAPDIQSASADGDTIVYETVGALHVVDLASGKARRVAIRIDADIQDAQPHYVKANEQVVAAGISPTGVRAVFSAHGDILTVPAKDGDIRNITRSPGADDRYPAWSPDGKWIAYFSDRSGENALYLSPQDGLAPARKIDLGQPGLFYYSPVWSPDGTKIAYTDQFLNLWYVDVATGKPVKVATDYYYSIRPVVGKPTFGPVFSPDSRYLAYARLMANHMRAIFIYSLQTRASHRITNSGADARYPAWDASGKYLYFTESTDVGPTTGWLDLSGYHRPVTRSVYAVVLRKGDPSPLAPESGDDHGANHKADGTPPAQADPVRIDFDGIGQRMVALPVPSKRITGLQAAGPGVLFVAVGDPLHDSVSRGGPRGDPNEIYKFDLASGKAGKFLDKVAMFDVSADGKHLLYGQKGKEGDNWFITDTGASHGAEGARQLPADDMQVWVEPRAEWREMYREAWRIMRNFFYDKNLHGLDSQTAEKLYQPYVDNLVSKSGLDYILNDMRGELVNSHVFVGGGFDKPSDQPRTGLLGADFTIVDDRYRFAHIYGAGHWNPDLKAPLAQPGLDVHAGDFLLAVDGRTLKAGDNVYRLLQGTAGKQTVLEVGPDPGGRGARRITVEPVRSEFELREQAWVRGNLQKVDELSHGKIAYVYLPDTAAGGYDNFNRYFFSQVDKQGVIIDERFNGGGFISDYIIDYLRRRLVNYWQTRQGHVSMDPEGAIYGPKAMLINGFAVSGGDALPWYFKQLHLGTLIGMRTTGGLNAVAGAPALIDGTFASVPRVAIFGPNGQPVVENQGVAPDIQVPLSPAAWRKGRDPQLEKAVSVVLQALARQPAAQVKPPPFRNYHQHPAVSPPDGER